MLSGESTVAVELLVENDELMSLIKAETAYETLLEYINENW